MTYTLWDKASPIYDITAEQAMINNPLYASEDSYLFLREDGSIYDILPISAIHTAVGGELSDVEACQAYIDMLTAPPQALPSGDVTALAARVAELEEQLATIENVNKTILGVE